MARRRFSADTALTFPIWAWVVFFVVLPTTLIIYYSFGYKPDLFTAVSTDRLSLDQYRETFDATLFNTFWNTLQIGIVGTVLCLVISLPFAYWLAVKAPPKARPMLLALVLVPFWTNFLVRTLGWQITLAPEGWLSEALQFMHLTDGPLELLYTRAAVQLGVVYNYLPLMILPMYVAFERTDPSQREASRDLGAGRVRTFFNVTLPDALPGIASGALLVFIPLMGDYITASVLGGARGNMVGQLVAAQFEQAQNWALGSAMAVVLMGFTLGTVILTALVFLTVRAVLRRSRRIDLTGGAVGVAR